MESVPEDPGDEALRRLVLAYTQANYPIEIRQMRAAGTWDDYVDTQIQSARNYASALIEAGVAPSKAWRRAIRKRILEQKPK